MLPNNYYERKLTRAGFRHIAGIDEVGRGALAGPVVVAAVILPPGLSLRGLKDSKLLTKNQREYFYNIIKEECLAFAVASVGSGVIDRNGIMQALQRAMQRSYKRLSKKPDQLLIDGLKFFNPRVETQFIIKGDQKVASIAAASVMAKVTRDRFMVALEKKFPEFSFAKHKGYGTVRHLAELKRHGPCKVHRFSYQPINGLT